MEPLHFVWTLRLVWCKANNIRQGGKGWLLADQHDTEYIQQEQKVSNRCSINSLPSRLQKRSHPIYYIYHRWVLNIKHWRKYQFGRNKYWWVEAKKYNLTNLAELAKKTVSSLAAAAGWRGGEGCLLPVAPKVRARWFSTRPCNVSRLGMACQWRPEVLTNQELRNKLLRVWPD